MRYRLSKRLFGITLSLMLVLMFLTYFAQAFLFEKFYSYKRTMSLVHEVNKFSTLYSMHISEPAEIYPVLKKFENDNNAKILILSLDGSIIYSPNQLYTDKESFNELTSFCSELINNKSLINDVTRNSNTRYTTFYNASSDLQKIGVIAPMSLNYKNDSLIFCVSSIQSIKEASEVIDEFLIYLFLGLVAISVILSSIYSNLISKPLVTLTYVANKMSNMDFSVTCSTNREDEIGSLAKSLNFLSNNLQTALLDLQKKNKKLEEDIEKERELENMRKGFVDNVSHELKTPIGIIEGYAEGLKDGIVTGEDAKLYLETIIDEAQKMGILVSNMLELSKLESGVIKLSPEAFNINRLIKKILAKHTPNFEEHDFKVNFTSTNPYSYVYADPFKMEQVMTNLVTNAIKYTPPHNTINIAIEEELHRYKIIVQNLGTYIPEDEIDKLFDKFYRLDKSRERTQQNSTGHGLAIVKNILELHKSEFKFHNIDEGVEFYFYLEKIVSPEDNDEIE